MKKSIIKLFALCLSLTLSFQTANVSASEESEVMFRLYNPNSGEHFYTAHSAERNSLVKAGWKSEGIGWIAPKYSTTPVYRLYNPNAGDHHYTISQLERAFLIRTGWNDEGIGWYSDDEKRVPLYRQYNRHALAGSHNYTTNRNEHLDLVSKGWLDEGIGWFALEGGRSAQPTDIYHPILTDAVQIVRDKGKFDYFEGLHGVNEYVFTGMADSLDDFGYAIRDISGDNVPELVIVAQSTGNVLALYTIIDNEPVLTFSGWIRSRNYYAGGSTFISDGSGGAMSNGTGLFSLSRDGRNKMYSEYYFTDVDSDSSQYSTYFNTTGIYGASKSQKLGGPEIYSQQSARLRAKQQKMDLIPLSAWYY